MEEMLGSEEEDEQMLQLPGFRFHPTDEELVGFYLSKKVRLKKPNKIDEIITQVDIYKFDPWDLPKSRNTEKESYFFCKRGRKYRNSIRPNRVTGSGFWKATGIDKPVYSDSNNKTLVIGLKKTLVYYLGSAGKGNKTDWMMHEFRLPTPNDTIPGGGHIHPKPNPNPTSSSFLHAEVWTLCRIFKRNVSSRKYSPDWRELAAGKRVKQQQSDSYHEAYIRFGDNESISSTNIINVPEDNGNYERSILQPHQTPNPIFMGTPAHVGSVTSVPHFSNDDINNETYENWDELRSVVEFAFPHSSRT